VNLKRQKSGFLWAFWYAAKPRTREANGCEHRNEQEQSDVTLGVHVDHFKESH
jgi:hypothetical protein